MIFRYSVKISLLCLLALSSAYLQAKTFDLDSAVEYALKHNPNLNAVQHQAIAAGARTQVSKAGHLPTLTLSHSARISDNPLDAFADKLNTRQVTSLDFEPARLNNPDSSELYFTQLALRFPLYSGGRTSALVEQAEQTEKNYQLQYERQREQVAYATIRAYLYVQATAHGLLIAKDAVNAARQHANTTTKLARQDRIVESDKLAAKVSLAAIRSQHKQEATRHRSALDEFKLVTGLPLDSKISLAKPKVPSINKKVTVKEYTKRALNNRKDLAAARALVQAAQARVNVARALRKPSFDLVVNSNWYNDDPGFENQSYSIMGVFSLDLYDGKSSRKIDVTLAKQHEMKWQLQSLERSVQKQVHDAYNNFIESRGRLRVAKNNVKNAKRTIRLVKKRYGQGRTILLDLLQAERLYTNARIEKLMAGLKLNISKVALPLATGTLTLPAMVSP